MVVAILSSLLLTLFSPVFILKLGSFQTDIIERLNLAYLAGLMISKNFMLGAGLGTFIVNIPIIHEGINYSWLLQPVHNIFFADILGNRNCWSLGLLLWHL